MIVGGGIAGLATAWQLTELGLRDVVLLEREPLLATHASGRNAAIFLPLEESLSAVWLASRSRELLDARIGTSWLSAQGVALVTSDRDALDELKFSARRLGVFHERWARDELDHRLPLLRQGDCTEALYLPLGGIMDVHLVLMRMRRWAESAGVRVVSGVEVAALQLEHGRATGVRLCDGRVVHGERVVLAAGAWAASLGAEAGSTLALTPLRRHLVHLVGPDMPPRDSPVTWRVDDPTYFRPEAGGVLASPCDEEPFEPCVPPSDTAAIEALAMRLDALAPRLLQTASVRRMWACLRTMSSDRELVVGADRRVPGLYWCAGLGGRGMTCGTAAGELLARTMLGLPHPLARTLSPERFG